jgi:hypothetical protein
MPTASFRKIEVYISCCLSAELQTNEDGHYRDRVLASPQNSTFSSRFYTCYCLSIVVFCLRLGLLILSILYISKTLSVSKIILNVNINRQ